jgi:hypothetical protein
MLVYVSTITPRITYIFQYISAIFGWDIELTDSVSRYKNTATPKINYSIDKIEEDEYQITPCGLLHERGIRKVDIKMTYSGKLPCFFETSGTLTFDLPAAVFYLLSRYEEYLPFQADVYGRYPHQNSIAYQEDFLHRALVDEWMNEWANQLKEIFPGLSMQRPSFHFIPTYDIDIAWSYLHKGWIRNIGGGLRSIHTLAERIRVITGKEKDPFDCYEMLQHLHEKKPEWPIYFFLVANKRSSLDKNINPKNKALQVLIKKIRTYAMIGLHPSGYSHTENSAILNEKKILEEICDKPVVHSRQHYLKFTLPQTYHKLIEIGIEHDYSMGYGTINGFRASTSRSFLWYDLENEKCTSLRLHPLAWMDANTYYENKFTAEEGLKELLQFYNTVRSTGGDFITVSHNHLLGKKSEWGKWPALYMDFIKNTLEKN